MNNEMGVLDFSALVAYSYLGYPLWLWLRSWWSPRPVLRGVEPAVSVAMVVRNEEATIAAKLDNLLWAGLSPGETGDGGRHLGWFGGWHGPRSCKN
jgi:Na+/H+-dicarboxylate symporter